MIYALTVTIAAGLFLLALFAIGIAFARRAAGADWPSIGRWHWYPTPLGLLVLLPIAGLLLWRLFPLLLFIPVVLPFLLRGGRFGPTIYRLWNLGRRPPPGDDGPDGDDDDNSIEGRYRPLDDD